MRIFRIPKSLATESEQFVNSQVKFIHQEGNRAAGMQYEWLQYEQRCNARYKGASVAQWISVLSRRNGPGVSH